MIVAVKILLIIFGIAVLAYPILPLPSKARRFSTFYSLRYNPPHNKKNVVFVLATIAEFILIAFLFETIDGFAAFLQSLPILGNIFASVTGSFSSQFNFILFAIRLVLVNAFLLYSFVFVKALLKNAVFDPIFGFRRKKKRERKSWKQRWRERKERKKKKNAVDDTQKNDSEKTPEQIIEEEEEQRRKRNRIPRFIHSDEEEEKGDDSTPPVEGEDDVDENGKKEKKPLPKPIAAIYNFFSGIFFEGEDYAYARPWVIRVRVVLQSFIYLVEVLYFILFTVVLVSVFFPLPTFLYNLLINILHVQDWYLYPFISTIFLQEICNIFRTPIPTPVEEEDKKEQELKKEQKSREARLRALQSELKKRFDKEHALRYYPESVPAEPAEYICTNRPYASALEYIKKYMNATTGRVVQSYMEWMDAVYNEEHTYFAASFYSELGEYLIAYTYIRLLSGARMIFVVSDPEEKESLKHYISDRLMQMTGSSPTCTWRVYTADERLDQADVLIACASDFRDDNIVEQFPGFFEEVSNAVFIDADRTVALDSYLCPVMARRLQKATDNRVRFVFLSLDLLKGFAAAVLPKFFSIDKVLSFSSAKENEAVSYTLWNRESKRNRIYNKDGQKLTSLECIIAEQACLHGVDGVRLMTSSPLEHADRKILSLHNVEINNLYKTVSDVNYMIYSDERCNLSAALYACTRFRGRKNSVVHILSKPYLLREYFMSKAATEDYINRSSFIQPRVTEHAERHKLSLLRIFCDATAENGIRISEFVARMKNAISLARERGDIICSHYCREIMKGDISALPIKTLAAYLIAGLYDEYGTAPEDSVAHKAKDYYLIVDPAKQDGYTLMREKYIVFRRVKEVFDRLFACNQRVALRLNDECIGMLDTFPSRVHLEYIAGQSIIYNNSEYEIEHIAEDGKTIFLRRENINFKNCLDTVLLRRYQIESFEQIGEAGVLNNSQSVLEEIRVTKFRTAFTGETYGFYSLMTDRQTLDFYRGVEGNPHVDKKNIRTFDEGRVLLVSLSARMECNDGMRMLMAAVFNEFIRTIFPSAYRCIAICPVLEEPLPFHEDNEPESEIDLIRALYPYVKNAEGAFVETEKDRMQFLLINDCIEDIGALDWFYDRSARYMQEFLANIYSYLHWLQLHPTKNHYIYFGGKTLPECYDLDGCCKLLRDFNMLLSDDGKRDIETAGDDPIPEDLERCSFCHKMMESGRYSYFDKHRFICADCFDVVDEKEQIDELYDEVRKYVTKTYPEVVFAAARADLDPTYQLPEGKVLSEYYYRLDKATRTVFAERDIPITNAKVAILRGLVELWQSDNNLMISHAPAQLYYEELCFLRSIGEDESAEWIYGALDPSLRANVDEIADYVNFKDKTEDAKSEEEEDKNTVEEVFEEDETETDEGEEETPVPNGDADEVSEEEDEKKTGGESVPENAERRTSFMFMNMKAKELDSDDEPEPDDDEEGSDGLYDPNKVPRFWKRYLRGDCLDNGEEEGSADDEMSDATEDSDTEDDDASDEETFGEDLVVNAPLELEDLAEDEMTDEEPLETELSDKEKKRAEKQRAKEEKKRLKEERKRQKAEEKQCRKDAKKNKNAVTDPEEGETDETPAKKEKKSLFGIFKRKKKDGKDTGTTETDDGDGGTKGESDEKNVTDEKDTGKKSKKDKTDKKDAKGKKKTKKSKHMPVEEEEKSNPKIRVYNDMVRAAFGYSEAWFSREGVSDEELSQIFAYFGGDYPEAFWISGYSYNIREVKLLYRCKTRDGKLDVKQIKQKRKELHKAAKTFTKGITRKTNPYEALLTIYRRLILTLDYDGVGLNSNVSADTQRDDVLRSLHSALVEHKVVCAGYAVAMQYLLQSVGITCGYVVSESAGNSCHAFNIVKIGKCCYYLDATWGDYSNTKTGDRYHGDVFYDYCCVPYNEFTKTSAGQEPFHVPRKEYYPTLETFSYTTHEYFRYHGAYLSRYDEREIARIIKEAALSFDEKEMGSFAIMFRCADSSLMNYVYRNLMGGTFERLLKSAKEEVAEESKKAAKLLERERDSVYPNERTGTLYIRFKTPPKKKQKDDKKKK